MPTPIFHTNHSLRSILNMEKPGKQKNRESPSLFDCAADLGLKEVVVLDDTPTAFMHLFKECPKHGLSLVYGLRLIVCNDVKDLSTVSHAKYYVISKTGASYNKLSKIFSRSAKEFLWRVDKLTFYRRIDWAALREMWDDDLQLVPCFYDGPIFVNLLMGGEHIPDYSFTKPIFEIQNHDLPFDYLIQEEIEKKNVDVWNTHSIYYRKKWEFKAFMTYRAMLNSNARNKCSFHMPELPFCMRDSFCAEALV